MIGRSGERGISVLAARHDNDDEGFQATKKCSLFSINSYTFTFEPNAQNLLGEKERLLVIRLILIYFCIC